MGASFYGVKDTVQLLADLGADVNKVDSNGVSGA